MPITPRLSRRLRQTLGEEAASDLTTWMQHTDAQSVELSRLDARFAELRAHFAELRESTRADIAELRGELHALDARTQTGFAQLRQEMQAGFAALETKLEQRTADLMKWSFLFWVGAVGAIAVLAGVLR